MTDAAGGTTHAASAGAADAGTRLDRFLAAALPELSRARLQALLRAGHVRADGETIADASYRVKPGQRFTVTVPPPAPARPQGEAIPLEVIYEDAHLIVIDKPAGLVIHPAPGNPRHTLVNALIAHCGESLAGIGGERRPGIVHRIDKGTSGLVVAAKSDAAYAGLAAQFAAHTVERAYLAIVWGVPLPRRGEIRGAIGRDPGNRKKMAVVKRGGRPARTHYRVLEGFAESASLLECRLDTGRTHQIRVHLAHRGHPLIGDAAYGRARRGRLAALPAALGEAVLNLGRPALHAHRLGFRHPLSDAGLRFESPLPGDLRSLLAQMESL